MSFVPRVYHLPDTTVWHGDALDVLAQHIPDNSIDLICADPPYNIGKNFAGAIEKWPNEQSYVDWCYQWLALCVDKLTPTGSLYLMTATQFMPYFDLFLRDKLLIRARIVWYYDSSGVQARHNYGSRYEPILYAVKNSRHFTFNAPDILVEAKTGAKRKLIDHRKSPPQQYSSTKVPGNVWEIPRVRFRMPEYQTHPTQKPIALLERIIKASSNLGDMILDPFAGSFTTCFVAQNLGRRSIGIEKQEIYVQQGLERLGKIK